MELTELINFDITEAACRSLAGLYMELRITSEKDLSGFRAVHEARMVVKGKRVEVEKRRKALKEDGLAYGRMVDGEAQRIFCLLSPIETHLEDEEKAYIILKEKKIVEAEEAEQRRLQGMFDILAGLGIMLPWAEIKAMSAETYQAKLEEARKAAEIEKERQAEAAGGAAAQAAEQARIEAEKKAARDAEAGRLAEVAEKQARKEAELMAEEKRLRIERARMEEEARRQVLAATEGKRLEEAEAPKARLAMEPEAETTEKLLRLFNASGHPILDEGVEVVGEVAIPNVDLANPKTIFSLALTIAKAAQSACEGGIPIALPGMTTLAAYVLAMLQGMTGQLPVIAWAARVDAKFIWSRGRVIDLHAMRILMREDR